MKDSMGKHSNDDSIEATTPVISPVKSLTPTKYHPLMAPDHEASSDDDNVVSLPPPAVTPKEANLVPFLQLSPEVAQETPEADLKVSQLDDQHNNNSSATDNEVEIFEGIESMSQQQQNLSTTCVENNNHVEEPKNPQQEIMTKSTEKLEGEFVVHSFQRLQLTLLLSDELNEVNKKKSDYPPLPDWVVVGESVLIRPSNTSGVIEFIGPTHFQVRIVGQHTLSRACAYWSSKR